MPKIRCDKCGGTVEWNERETEGVCKACGAKQTLPEGTGGAGKKRRSKGIVVGVVVACVVLIAALAVLAVRFVLPELNYGKAVALYEAGQYEEAIAAFTAMDGYKDSEERIKACKTAIRDRQYDDAAALYEAGRYEEAIAAFTAMNGYRDSEQQIEACETAIRDQKYDDAAALYEAGRFEEAIAAFTAMNGYKDSEDRITECRYGAALALYEAGQFEEAIAAFAALDGYKDSAQQIVNCQNAILDQRYAAAEALLEGGSYREAIEAFTALSGYRESAAKIEEAMPLYYRDTLKTAKKGDTVLFGRYEQDNDAADGKEPIEWTVLSKDNNRILVISRYALDCQPFHSVFASANWSTCSLRGWLNGTFLGAAFNADEQKMIRTTTVIGEKNPSYRSTPAGPNTPDKVFVLGIREANLYFSSDEQRKGVATAYAIAQGAAVSNKEFVGEQGTSWWWLRTSGTSVNYVSLVGSDGSVNAFGSYLRNMNGAVRPALWIDLNTIS